MPEGVHPAAHPLGHVPVPGTLRRSEPRVMRVSHLRSCDIAALRQAFRNTIAPGRSLHEGIPTPEVLDAYEALSLDWFLREPSPSAVGILHDTRHEIRGYALVCVAPETFASWRRAALVRYFGRITPLLAGKRSSEAAQFVLLHALDHGAPWRRRRANVAGLPSAHLSITGTTPRHAALHAFAEFVDDQCRSAGFDRWLGEIDEPPSQVTSIEALGADIVCRTPIRTLSWLRGEALDRLAFVRTVPRPSDEAASAPIAWIGPQLREPGHARPA